jgi:hypothetical protein
MSKVFNVKLDDDEAKRFDACVAYSGLKSGAALFRLMLIKYEREVCKHQEKETKHESQ